MPIKKATGRQEIISASVEFNLADVANGVNEAAIQLPGNAIVVGGDLVVLTVFNSVTTDTLSVGDAASGARYLGATNAKALARTALAPTGFVTTNQSDVTVNWAGVGGGGTTGRARLTLQYVVSTRSEFSQG